MTASDDDQPSSFHRAFGRCACAACGGGGRRGEAANEASDADSAGILRGDARAVAELVDEGTNDARIDGLLAGSRWTRDDAASGFTISYSFGLSAADYDPDYYDGEPFRDFSPLNETARNAIRTALESWAGVANITFVEVDETGGGSGAIRFANTSQSATAHAYYPSPFIEGGDVWFGEYFWDSDFDRGSYDWLTVVHEIGHALGLKHPHEQYSYLYQLGGAPVLSSSLDWLGQTVMSYKDFAGDGAGPNDFYTMNIYPDGPMALDILAIQELYGANTTHNSDDTVYGFAVGERMFETIWDTGGIDTLDWSNQSRAGVIRLAEGAFSELGTAVTWDPRDGGSGRHAGTVAIAHGAEIENANGGSGADQLYGNTLANRLHGGGGADQLSGSMGDDVLIGGTSPDTITGGSGDDVMAGGTSYDTLTAGSGNDILFGETGSDILDAGSGDDFLIGGTGDDRLDGGAGYDIAVYAGRLDDFTVTRTRTGYSVRDDDRSDGYFGTDQVTGVQALLFDDGLYHLSSGEMRAIPPTLPDLDQLILTA